MESSFSVVVLAITGLAAFPVFGLTGFHIGLVVMGRTTNEQVLYCTPFTLYLFILSLCTIFTKALPGNQHTLSTCMLGSARETTTIAFQIKIVNLLCMYNKNSSWLTSCQALDKRDRQIPKVSPSLKKSGIQTWKYCSVLPFVTSDLNIFKQSYCSVSFIAHNVTFRLGNKLLEYLSR